MVVGAPRDEIPIFVRAGSIVPMLAPDVYTLAEHGAGNPSVVRLADRADQLHLLAFPRGQTSGKFFDTGTYSSVGSADSWAQVVEDSEPHTVHVQANMKALLQPFEPCTVSVGGTELVGSEWVYDSVMGVLSVSFENTAGALQVDGC